MTTDKTPDAISTFNHILEELVSNQQYATARGALLSAILLAQSDPSAPAEVVPNLLVSYTQILDVELQGIISHAKGGLTLLGISEADVKAAVTGQAKPSGGSNGPTH